MKRGPNAQTLLDAITQAHNAGAAGITSTELAKKTGIEAGNIGGFLRQDIEDGRILIRKVKASRGRQNEYRLASGPVKPFAAPGTWFAPAAVVPDPSAKTNRSSKQAAQPEVANTGSASLRSSYPPRGCAVAEKPPTVSPKGATPSVGNEGINPSPGYHITLNSEGCLDITADKSKVCLNPDQVLALGDFLHATQGVWRP